MSLEHVLSMIEEHKVRYIDLRFTDTRGKEQHLTIPAHQVNDDFFEEGKCSMVPLLVAGKVLTNQTWY